MPLDARHVTDVLHKQKERERERERESLQSGR